METTTKKMNIPIEDQKKFIAAYEQTRELYAEFAVLLDKILNQAVEELKILAIVQSRPKSLVSFTNKIISKDKYKNPLTDMTDLCGARVIVHFQSQVEKICSFIKENFEIDEANSLDTRSRLQVNEFGYRSVHYIVSPQKAEIAGVKTDEKFKNLKAEIQIRTLAEHVWADISHDRIYKTNLNIPEEWKREAARLSAILENADKIFAEMSQKIDSLASVYELQLYEANRIKDTEKLKALIAVFKEGNADELIKNILNLTALYRATDDIDIALDLLKNHKDIKAKNPVLQHKFIFEYALMLMMHSGDMYNDMNEEALMLIENSLTEIEKYDKAGFEDAKDELSLIYYRYARILQRFPDEIQRQSQYYLKAYNLMPDNPLYLVAMVETLLLRNIDIASFQIASYRSKLQEAIPKIQELMEIGIKKVTAWFAIGHIYLLLNNETECINAYSKAVDVINDSKLLSSKATIKAEIELIKRFKNINSSLSEQVFMYLNMALYLSGDKKYESYCRKNMECKKLIHTDLKKPLIIVAGGAALMDKEKLLQSKAYLEEILYRFKGSIISGGTTAGIPGLLAEVSKTIQHNKEFELIAYLPENLPANDLKSDAYDVFCKTKGKTYSALDILSCWNDIILQGINPAEVILIGINGGNIAGMEYRIALALGAKVVLVANTGRASSDLILDKLWKNHPNIIQLPEDPLSLWAMVNQTAETILSDEEIEKLACFAHEYYRETALNKFESNTNDINKYKVIMPWNKLDPVLQQSNLKQLAFYEQILGRVGLKIRKSENPVLMNIEENLDREKFEFLAKLEHARWIAERLLGGWKFAAGNKDIIKKTHPSITAWKNLDDFTKDFDYNVITKIPLLLEKIGYEIYS